MKKIISLLLAVVLIIGCLAVLTSCSSAKKGAEINIYLGNQVYDFDPTDYYVDSNAEQVMSLLFEPLFKVNSSGDLECAAAEGYEVNEYNRTIKVWLRETYWSDGVRVTASDFLYAWSERLLSPNNPNPAASLLYDIENAVAVKNGVESINNVGVSASGYTLTISYNRDADVDQLLRNLASVATSPLRQGVVETAPTYWSKNKNTLVTNGPFSVKLLDWETCELTLERNLGYHQYPEMKDYDNRVSPGELHAVFTASGEQIEVSYADIENNTRFILTDAPLSDRQEYADKGYTVDDTSVYTYVFNTEHPLFAIANVRKALNLVIDRNAIIEAVTVGKPANGFIPDVSGGSNEALISAEAKIAEAEELLAAVESELAGIDKSFTLIIDNNEESIAIAEIVVPAWESLGFDVTVYTAGTIDSEIAGTVIVDSEIQVFVKEASYGNVMYDVIAVDWQTYCDDAFAGLASMSYNLNGCGVDFSTDIRRNNIAGWFNSDYDRLLIEAMKCKGSERAEYLAEAEAILVEEAPICPIIFNQSVAYRSSKVTGLSRDGFGNIVFTKTNLKGYKNYPGTNGIVISDDDETED